MRLKRSTMATGLVACVFQVAVASAQGNAACGSLQSGYGPFDYRTDKDKLQVVERYHFTPEVEALLKGKSTGYPGGDLAYVLRAFPNHHRALMAMTKLAQKEKAATPKGSTYSMECWFERAGRFRSNDPMVKVIHGLYLIQTGRSAAALTQLEAARELDSRDANIHYNLGLAYFDVGQYEKSLQSAHLAYAAGFPLPGLREKLKRAGKWREVVQ